MKSQSALEIYIGLKRILMHNSLQHAPISKGLAGFCNNGQIFIAMRWRWLLLHGNAMPMVFGCVLTLPSVRFFAEPLELIILRFFFQHPRCIVLCYICILGQFIALSSKLKISLALWASLLVRVVQWPDNANVGSQSQTQPNTQIQNTKIPKQNTKHKDTQIEKY